MAVIGALVYKIMADVADITKNTSEVVAQLGRMESAATRVGRSLQTFAGAMGVSLSAGAFVQVGRAAMAYADSLGELAEGAGVTVEALQGLGYAAAQNGSSLEGMAQALQVLGERLGSGDTAVVGAIKRLGLNFDEIRRASPDVAFREIAAALREVEDANERNALAADTLGKSWKSLMPTVMSAIEELERAAPRLSQSQVDALGKAQDAWDGLILRIKVGFGQAIAQAESDIARIKNLEIDFSPWRELGDQRLKESLPGLPDGPRAPKAPGLPGIDLEAAERAMRRQEQTAKEMAHAATQAAEEWNRAYAAMQRETEARAEKIVAAMMRQKDVINNLTANILNEFAEMQARQGFTAGGEALPGGEAGAIELQYQQRVNELGLMRKQLPDQDPNSFLQRRIDDLLADAWTQYQEALFRQAQGSTTAADSSSALGRELETAAGSTAGFSRAVSDAIPDLMSALSRATTAGMSGMVMGGGVGQIASNPAGMLTGAGDSIPVFGAGGFLGYRKIGSFASGGYAAGPTLAIVGDSPGGETMIPGRVGAGGISIAVTVHAQGATFQSPQSLDALARRTADILADKLRSQGRLL
ncbi:MAG: hypothetical protein KBA95_01855 [Acidobacteria bacterium]|nr:hypothetical protein [Acidobacteriota bacterium]